MAPFYLKSRLSTAVVLLLSSQQAFTKPVSWKDEAVAMEGELDILARGCANPCGWSGQLCCAAGEACFTDRFDRAQCGGGGTAGGSWEYVTRTWVETDENTYTSVYSTYVGGAPSPEATATCNTARNESPCGSICCASDQYCQLVDQCAPAAPGRTTGPGGPIATGSATVTQPFEAPVATGANITLTAAEAEGGGLSGGAIAGIVFAVLLLLFLLALLCIFCCFKALWKSLMALLGIGRGRRRHETEYIEEHHHHHGHGVAPVGGGRRWYGDRPSRIERPPKKSGGLGGFGAVAAGLGSLGLALGLKRKHDRRQEKSNYTGSGASYSYYSSDYTSESSESSSDRHTRHTRRSSRR